MAIAFILFQLNQVLAQNDSKAVDLQDSASSRNRQDYQLDYRHLIAPAVFIGFGVAGLESDALKELNSSTRFEIHEHALDKLHLDNYTQYVPALLVYGLNAAGVKGKHNFKERTIIYATSQLISAAFVVPLKHITNEERPDGSNNLSFPSGHTATAFSSAQFMFMEYKDSNFWLSISGYSFAVFTGVYRTINDKHWVGDIVAGAGFGILSTEMAYWLYPKINGIFDKRNGKSSTMLMPYYQNKGFGISLVKNF
ncbi:phosphatase PAP2 family protein [Sphingobacterium hungaricum]|nr:phosphatase PAP2 family protein [Sphingobacterium hungaricum]